MVLHHQNNFIKGKQITDAALVANDVLDLKQKSEESSLLFKLDIGKVFDKLNLTCLLYPLECP